MCALPACCPSEGARRGREAHDFAHLRRVMCCRETKWTPCLLQKVWRTRWSPPSLHCLNERQLISNLADHRNELDGRRVDRKLRRHHQHEIVRSDDRPKTMAARIFNWIDLKMLGSFWAKATCLVVSMSANWRLSDGQPG